MGLLRPGQYYTLVMAAIASSTLSFLGSSAVAIATYPKAASIYQRLVLYMSLVDAVGSLTNIMHPFLMPRRVRAAGLLWASGTDATCSAMGFFLNGFPPLVSFLSLYLSAYFYLKVNGNISDQVIVRRYIGPAMAIAVTLSLGTAATGSAIHGYAPRIYLNVCSFGDCEMGKLDTCQENTGLSWYLGWVEVVIIVVPAVLSLCLTMGVYLSVRNKLRKSRRYEFRETTAPVIETEGGDHRPPRPPRPSRHACSATESVQDAKLRAVRSQALCFSFAYWNSFIWLMLYGVLGGDEFVVNDKQSDPFYFSLSLFVWTFFPLQGFVNFLVYSRPRYLQWRENCPEQGRTWALHRAISMRAVSLTAHVRSNRPNRARTTTATTTTAAAVNINTQTTTSTASQVDGSVSSTSNIL